MSYQPSQHEIAAEAKRLWEQEGRPENKSDEHWAVAEDELKHRTLIDPSDQKTLSGVSFSLFKTALILVTIAIGIGVYWNRDSRRSNS